MLRSSIFIVTSFLCMSLPAGASIPPARDTVRVTVYVGNASQNAHGLVIDTETLTLCESGETSAGVFRSGTVILTDTLVVSVRDADRNHYAHTRHYEPNMTETDVIVRGKKYVTFHPLNRNYTDVAEVPKVARFAGANGSLFLLILASIAVFYIVSILFNRWNVSHEADALAGMQEEDILKSDPDILAEFCRRYPNHPSAKAAMMEAGRRFYDKMNYGQAAELLEKAVRKNPAEKNPESHFLLAHTYRRMDYLCDAIDEWMACYLDDPQGPLAKDAFREAQRWRAHQVVRDKEPCPQCGGDCRLTDVNCSNCGLDLKRTPIPCSICGKTMLKEAQICIHCLPDDIKTEVAVGTEWPVVKSTGLDWEAQLVKGRLTAAGISCVLTGEKGAAVMLTVGHLGQIDIRVPAADFESARDLIAQSPSAGSAAPRHQVPVSPTPAGDAISVPEPADSAPAFVPEAEIPAAPPAWKKPFKWTLTAVFAGASIWLLYDAGGWTVLSIVDGQKIRKRDVDVSIHSVPMGHAFKVGSYKDYREKLAGELSQTQLSRMEANILRGHLIAEGDSEHAGMDDEKLVAWGTETGRIVYR